MANAIGADAGWVSKNLRGPGNWTMKTFGAFVEGLNGEAQIIIRAAEDPSPVLTNYHAYVGYEPEIGITNSTKRVIGQVTPASSMRVGAPSIRKNMILNISVLIP